jgi:glycosyltransferase involved in cell wall biosynthesis
MNFIKQIIKKLPKFAQRFLLHVYENYFRFITTKKHVWLKKQAPKIRTGKKNILFYHISGLSFGGTEKFLQIIAKYINKNKYNVFYMYSPKPRVMTSDKPLDGRKGYLADSGVAFIDFSYEKLESTYPYRVVGASTTAEQIIAEKNIDILITAGSGYTEFPFNVITKIPILLINIFGSPNVQKNIVKNICISNEVANKIRPIVHEKNIETMYIQSEGPDKDAYERGRELRKQFNISDTSIVFGRIGRPDNNIFDPIGIRAFQKVVSAYPNAYYLIMSAPQVLIDIVTNEKIPNVYFVPPSSEESDVWAFHSAIDVMAHFRLDGESCGLNIIESMLCGKPIISHRSPYWNAQFEYLDDTFSWVADINDVQQYAKHMETCVELHAKDTLKEKGVLAKKKAGELFIMKNNTQKFETWIEQSISEKV